MTFFNYEADGASTDIARGGFLASVSDAEWALFRSHCEVRRYGAGALIARAGEVDRCVWVVLSGSVGFRVGGTRGAVQGDSRTGAVLGEVAFFDGEPRSADVVAVGEVELLQLSFDSFRRLDALEPALTRKLLFDLGRALAGRFRSADALLRGG